VELSGADFFCFAHLAVGESFADTNDWNESGGEGRFGFLGDGFVGLAKELASLGVSDDGVTAAGFGEHRSGDFAGEGAFFFPEDILTGNGDVSAARGLDRRGNRRERWGDDDVPIVGFGDERVELGEKRASVGDRLEHFPVTGD
jgi:hypothetical protein